MLLPRKRTPYRSDYQEGITLIAAYRELSQPGFGFWLRLSVLPRLEIERATVKGLSEQFGISKRAVWKYVSELRNKGYLRTPFQGNSKPSRLILVKKPLLSGNSSFILL